MKFPDNFVWGAASSAYQTEGSPLADGGGESVWDRFCAEDGHIANGENAQTACDGYNRYAEDIGFVSEMGLGAYRFSTSWARVDPNGDGKWNWKAVDYYDRVVDCCLQRHISPYMTLFHWETPQAVEDRGGWLSADTAKRFGEYASFMGEHFSGRVQNFFTLNEPEIVLLLGYGTGLHAPGKKLGQEELFECWKNMLCAHGFAFRALKAANPEVRVGIASTGRLCYPARPVDDETARRETFALRDDDWLFTHNLVLDGVCLGMLETVPGTRLHTLAAAVSKEDWKTIHAAPDMIGLNVYNGHMVRTGDGGAAEYVPRPVGCPRTALNWPITPEIMNSSLRYIQQRYHKPLYISECGQSCNDRVFLDGRVHDTDRIDFLRRYLFALGNGLEQSDVRGFFHWSLTDNFEWHSGYSQRFGLVYVDYSTQRRILKDSGRWYACIARSHGDAL